MSENEKKIDEQLNEGDTGTIEVMTDGLEKIEDTQMISETRVMERMTDVETIPSPKKEKSDEEKADDSSPLKEVILFLRDLAICMAIVLIVTTYVIRPIQVKGSSMYPTLENGEIGASNLIGYKMGEINRFDIVIIYLEDKDEYIVKRVIGLPNDTVSYLAGELYINGEVMDEPFLNQEYIDSLGEVFMQDMDEVALGDDEYFCLGDNRPHSTDSRYYGPFTKDMIMSKGVFILFPFNRFGVYTW